MPALPKVIVTTRLPEQVETRLSSLFDVSFSPDNKPMSRANLADALKTADALLPTVTDIFDADLLGAGGHHAGIIANFAVGVNNIDLAAAGAAGIVVTNTPGVLTEATADIALMLILNATRRGWEHEGLLRRGEWDGFRPTAYLGTGLQGKLLGIIGMGRIGQATARRGIALGMKVIYFNRSAVEIDFPAQAAGSMRDVMAAADVVSLHIPGGEGNRGAISAELIAAMKPAAYLVNTARGDVVDEEALVAALVAGRIAGAGLDVFAAEPRVPAALLGLNNVALLPHLGSATVETRTAMGMLAVDNLVAHFGDQNYPSRVV